MANIKEQTFLGSIRISSRVKFFASFLILASLSIAAILYYGDSTLKKINQSHDKSSSIFIHAKNIEKNFWLLKGLTEKYSIKKERRFLNEYFEVIKLLNSSLEALETNSAADEVEEHIATINDGIDQHKNSFKAFSKLDIKKFNSEIENLTKTLNQSADSLVKKLNQLAITSLKDSFKTALSLEKKFKVSADTSALRSHAKQLDDLNRLLNSAPISIKDRKIIKKLINLYQNNMTRYASIKLTQFKLRNRLNEIFDYLLPSLNGIKNFAQNYSARIKDNSNKNKKEIILTIVISIGVIVILLLLTSLLILQSLSLPIRKIAESAENIIKGDHEADLPALGNHDEIGEIARAINLLKENLIKFSNLENDLILSRKNLVEKEKSFNEIKNLEQSKSKSLKKANENLKALQEALSQEELRSQALKETLDKASRAKALFDEKEPPYVSIEVDKPIESITALTNQLAQSSQTASIAAIEAEQTSVLIKGLNQAESKLDELEPLIRVIGKETNIPALSKKIERADNTRNSDMHLNLVALSVEQNNSTGEINQEFQNRFEKLRKVAIQVLQTVRNINKAVSESKAAALEIAAASSENALEITKNLLNQSENLRGMLNSLGNKLNPIEKPRDSKEQKNDE